MIYDYQAPPESYFPTTMEENDDLRCAIDNAPHVVTFWCAVCAYINHERGHGEDPDRVLEFPSWGQWRSIEQHLAAGLRIEASELLRASTCVWEKKPLPVPAFVTSTLWKEFMLGNGVRQWEHRGGLGLAEAKGIIETFENYPQWFGRDTTRTFENYPRWFGQATTRAFTVAPEQEEALNPLREQPPAPSNLGASLREALERLEAPKEHSLWLNVYPEEPGYCLVGVHESREVADQYANSSRIACINIKFKEGEGL